MQTLSVCLPRECSVSNLLYCDVFLSEAAGFDSSGVDWMVKRGCCLMEAGGWKEEAKNKSKMKLKLTQMDG